MPNEMTAVEPAAADDDLDQMLHEMQSRGASPRRGEEGADAPSRTANSADADDASEDDDPTARQGAPGGKAASKQQLRQFLEAHAEDFPGGVEALRALDQTNTRNANAAREVQALREQMAEMRGLVQSLRQPQQPAAPTDPQQQRINEMKARMTPEQRALLAEVLKEHGVVTRDELEARESERQSETFAATARTRALERFGDDMGTVDAQGRFQWNPELREEVGATIRRLEQQGITDEDLYLLVRRDALLSEGARSRQDRAEDDALAEKKRRLPGTVRRTAAVGATGRTPIYDKNKSDRDNLRRFMGESMREILGR